MFVLNQALTLTLKVPNRVQPEFVPRPDRIGKYTNKMHYFKKHILDEVAKKKFAIDFMEPVDTEVLHVPSYYTVIDSPMDIGTIIKRVENNYYESIWEPIKDFHLVIRNCFKFNQPGDVVFRKGQMLEKFFVKKLKNMPSGDEIVCNKDPRVTARQHAANAAIQHNITNKLCRDFTKKLQHTTSQADTQTQNVFNSKWEALLKKVDRGYFKTVDEFKAYVDNIFKKYHDAATLIYESAFEQREALVGSTTLIGKHELDELVKAAFAAEVELRECINTSFIWDKSRAHNTITEFSSKVNQLKHRMEDKEPPAEQIVKEKTEQGNLCTFAHAMLTSAELSDLVTVVAESSEDESTSRRKLLINDKERRNIQLLFSKLPREDMREIVHMIQQLEGLCCDEYDRLSFDVQKFKPETLVLMKRSIAKTMRQNNKVNLRHMPKEQKDGLKRSLEGQLQDIKNLLKNGRKCRKVAKSTPVKYTKAHTATRKIATINRTLQRARNLSDSSSSSSAESRHLPEDIYPMKYSLSADNGIAKTTADQVKSTSDSDDENSTSSSSNSSTSSSSSSSSSNSGSGCSQMH